jgi:anthranilate/para-aminobenzoate synthase component I
VTVLDALHAVCPNGTMSGCSKGRTMPITHEPQYAPRCNRAGSDISCDGRFVFNARIRSALLRVLGIA